MFEFGWGEVALLASALLISGAIFLVQASRTTKVIIYTGAACALIGVLAGYSTIGAVMWIAAFAAGTIVQIVTVLARS